MGCAGAARLRMGRRSRMAKRVLYMVEKALVEDDVGVGRLKVRRVGLR